MTRNILGERIIIGRRMEDIAFPAKGLCWYFLSFLLALFFEVMWLGFGGQWWRPDLLFLTMCFWLFYFPNKFGFFTVFLSGLLLDAALGSYLGEHALFLVLISYLFVYAQRKFKFYSILQLIVLVIALEYLVLGGKVIFYAFLHKKGLSGLMLLSPITTALCLPVVVQVLRHGCRRFAISVQTPY